MFGSDNIKSMSVAVQDPGADDRQIFLWRAPAACEILRAYAITDATQGAGTAGSLALHIYSSAGTPALAGTVAAAVGGTAAPLTADVPSAYTISEGTLAAGQWLVADYQEDNDWSGGTQIMIVWDYVLGVGA